MFCSSLPYDIEGVGDVESDLIDDFGYFLIVGLNRWMDNKVNLKVHKSSEEQVRNG